MDIKKTIEDVVEKINSDDALKKQFMSDPAGALQRLTGIDIPAGQLDHVVSAVKAKLAAGDVGDMVKGLGGLFKK